MKHTTHYLAPRFFNRELWPQNDLWRRMDQMFNNFNTESELDYDDNNFTPATDIVERDNNYLLSVDLPGMKKDDIKIEVQDGMLVISGERQSEQKTETDKFQRNEKTYGFFKRTFSLPKSVDSNNIQAHHQDGVLEITLPKSQEVKTKKIEINNRV